MSIANLQDLVAEYERALSFTDDLWRDLTIDEVQWRPNAESSAIGWHLGHQATVAHFMVRNLTAAEPSPDPELDGLMDSATLERDRGVLPDLERLGTYRSNVAARVLSAVDRIACGDVGAPAQLSAIASPMLTAIINHEYQHSQWIGEVRRDDLGHALPDAPQSEFLTTIDGYTILTPAS